MNSIGSSISKSVSIKEIDSKPEVIFNYLNYDWIKQKRWFVDKDAEILSLTCEDFFLFKCKSSIKIINGIILIELKSLNGLVYTKRYFIPVILSEKLIKTQNENKDEVSKIYFADGERYLFSAEQYLEYQQIVIENYRDSKAIDTYNGGKVHYNSGGERHEKLDTTNIEIKSLGVSTSNVLTYVHTGDYSFISKTYKDIRGGIKNTEKIWPINLEADRYKVLGEAGYNNVPQVYGIAYYLHSDGNKLPIGMLIDFIPNEGEAGNIFWQILTEKLENPDVDSNLIIKSIEKFCQGIAASLANMHIAFSMSDKDGFKAAPMSYQEGEKLAAMTLTGIYKNINTLKAKADNLIVLPQLIGKIEAGVNTLKDSDFFKNLHSILEQMIKIQIHGDLSTAQALICRHNELAITDKLLEYIRDFNEKEMENTIEKIIKNIRWIDFEGEPARDMVERSYDSRQNALRDVSSLIQGFWYALNIKVYLHLGFDAEKNPQDKEHVRKISMILSENIPVNESNIKGLNQELVDFVKQCFTVAKNSIINGYFAEIERHKKEHILSNAWDKESAKIVIEYFILLRAIHELGYESYARDWGWEAIPGGMIIQIIDRLIQFSDNAKLSAYGMKKVPGLLINKNKGFLPVYAGIAQDGLFLPFQHDHAKTENIFDERYHWGVGDFVSAKEGIDLASELGFNIRKILPITWSSAFHSPYSILSPEAFDPEYIGVPALLNMLEKNGIKAGKARKFIENKRELINELRRNKDMDHETITNLKMRTMKFIWRTFKNHKDSTIYMKFQKYRTSMTPELKEDLLYYILKKENMKKNADIGWDWRTWNQTINGITERTPEALEFVKNKYRRSLIFLEFIQFVLNMQWNELTLYAKSKGVEFMVDIPFAPADARVWQSPDIVVMLGKENHYHRFEIQGVPGKKETPVGQIWQFPVYNFSNIDAVRYLHSIFSINLKRAKYIRSDHTLGFYHIFVYHQDINEKMTLQNLGIYEAIENIRKRALQEGTQDAQKEAANQVYNIIKNALLYHKEGLPRLPEDVLELLFENGELRANGGNMLLIARKVEDTSKPNNAYWHRQYMVENEVLKGHPYWDFLRFTSNKRADDDGFAQKWLFPEDDTPEPLPTDGIQVAYYKPAPAESLLTDFERLCQQEGALLGHELLGNVPQELAVSIRTKIGGMDLNPKIWGLSRWSRYHPLNDYANSISMFGVADSTSIANAWTDFEDKEDLLKDFGIAPEEYSEHTKQLTPEVHEKLLKMAFVPQDIYPEIKDDCMPLISIIGLIDLAGLDDTYRLNFPSRQNSWYRKLPQEASTGELLDAARGKSNCQKSMKIVNLARRLVEARNRRKLEITEEVKILGMRPSQEVQIRRIFVKNPQYTLPFIVEAYVQGEPEGVFFSLFDENDNEVCTVPMKKLENNQYKNISNWIISLLPSVKRVYRYKIKVTTGETIIWSNRRFLTAVDEDDNLNPLSPNYVLKDLV